MINKFGRYFVFASFVVFQLLFTGCASVYMKGTPLYTGDYSRPQAPAEDRINIWPLLYYHDPALSILWPAGEKTDDHIAARPFFSAYKLDRKEHEYNFVWPLAEFDFDTDDHHILPFFWGDDYFVAFPLVWWYDDDRAILPFFWGDDYFVAFPEIWWNDYFKAILPVVWWDEGFTVFPLVWYEKNEFNHFFPLWLHSKYGKSHHDTYLMWPIFNLRNKSHEKGHRVWPLYGNYKKGDSGSYRFALWPLCHDYRNRNTGESTQVAVPLYYRRKYGSDELKVIPFLLYQERHGSSEMSLSPIWCAGKSGAAEWQAMLPFYYYSSDPEEKTSRFLTPIVGKTTSPKSSRWFVLPLSSSMAWGDKEKDVWFLAPFSRFRWGHMSVQNFVFPIYGYDSQERLFLSALFSRQDKEHEGFVNFGGIVSHYARNRNTRKYYFLPPFSKFQWGDGNHKGYIFPIYGYNENEKQVFTPLVSWQNKDKYGYVNLAGLLAHYERRNDRKSLKILPPFTDVRWKEGEGIKHTHIAPLFSWNKHGKRTSLWVAPWFSSTTSPTYRKCSLEPLWSYKKRIRKTREKETKNVNFQLLEWLYNYNKKTTAPAKDWPSEHREEYVKSSILWRVMHYERIDDHKTLDVFPFITYDRKKSEGFRKFSFAWRLIRYERGRNGGLNMDLLFLPIWRGGD